VFLSMIGSLSNYIVLNSPSLRLLTFFVMVTRLEQSMCLTATFYAVVTRLEQSMS